MKTPILAAMLLIFTATTSASGIVFDPTNFIKNTITAAEQIKATAARAAAYALQQEQLKTELMQAKGLNQGAVGAQMTDAINQARAARALQGSLETLYGSVSTVKSQFDGRIRDMAMSSLDWKSWFAREQIINSRKTAQGQQLMGSELAALNRVETDYQAANAASAKIPESAGVHESMQQLNISMARMSMQHAQLNELTAMRSRAQTEQEQETAARDQASRDAWAKTMAEQEAVHQKNLEDLREYKIKHGGK